MARQDVLDTIWEAPDDLWKEIEPVIEELDPQKATGRKREDLSDAPYFGYARAASGTGFRSVWAMTAPSIARSRGGNRPGCSPRSGPLSKPTAMSWEVWTGSGNRLTRRWARLVWGG